MFDHREQTRHLDTSHLAVQRQDPQTLAYPLNDSPAGMAAWVWERRLGWCDPDFVDDPADERDFLCTTASLFWFAQTIGTSMRFYKDNFGDAIGENLGRIEVPTGYGAGPNDLVYMPRVEAEAATNLQRWSMLPRGGHFSPHEWPEDIALEFGAFFGALK